MTLRALEVLVGDIAITEVVTMVKAPEEGPRMYTVTLRKYALSLEDSDREEPARWIIVDIADEAPT